MRALNQPQIVQAIILAADELIRRIIAWTQDEHGEPVVPKQVTTQLQTVDGIFSEAGVDNLPEPCQELFLKTRRLSEEHRAWAQREPGKVRQENGAPGPAFWAAVKQFVIYRANADQTLIEVLEPVSVLLKQGVSHMQIGQHIYGRKGIGPFIQANGDVNVALIEKESNSPGSVIPENWIPPWHAEAADRRRKELEEKLEVFSKMEVAQHYDDPCTVEEMLRDGCYVQQIERAKGVTRAEVLEAAAKLGMEAVDGPGYQPQYRDVDSTNAGGGVMAGVDPTEDQSEQKAPARGVSEELKAKIIEAYERDPSKGAAEIRAELMEAGHEVHWRTVSGTIGHYKKQRMQREVSGEVIPA